MTTPWRRAGRWLPRPLRRWLREQAADARYRRRDILPDFNDHSTFHSPSCLERVWSPLFAPRHYVWHGLNGYQDLSVWEAR